MAAVTGLLDGVREQLVRAPELACLLADRLVATEPGAAIERVGCGLRAAAGGPYRDDLRALIEAVSVAGDVDGPELEATLRMRLAAVARLAGAPRVALATLRPALDPRLSPRTTGLVLGAAVAALSSVGWHEDLRTLLANAEQLCVVDEWTGVEVSALSRAEILLTGARVVRRVGDRTSAAAFARDGLRTLDSLDGPDGPMSVGSGYFAALLLELVLVLSEADGASVELRRAVAKADETVRAPVRLAAAASTAWLAHALAAKVPPRERPRAPMSLLNDAIHISGRYDEFDVLAAAARELAAEQEQVGVLGAAKTVRTAELAAARHRLRMESIRGRLASCPVDDRSFEVILRELQDHAADVGGFVSGVPSLTASTASEDATEWSNVPEATTVIRPNGVAMLHGRADYPDALASATDESDTTQHDRPTVFASEVEETARLAMRLVPFEQPAALADEPGRRRRHNGSANLNGALLNAENPDAETYLETDGPAVGDPQRADNSNPARLDGGHTGRHGADSHPALIADTEHSTPVEQGENIEHDDGVERSATSEDSTANRETAETFVRSENRSPNDPAQTGLADDPVTEPPPPGLAHVSGLVVTEGSGGRRRAPESSAPEQRTSQGETIPGPRAERDTGASAWESSEAATDAAYEQQTDQLRRDSKVAEPASAHTTTPAPETNSNPAESLTSADQLTNADPSAHADSSTGSAPLTGADAETGSALSTDADSLTGADSKTPADSLTDTASLPGTDLKTGAGSSASTDPIIAVVPVTGSKPETGGEPNIGAESWAGAGGTTNGNPVTNSGSEFGARSDTSAVAETNSTDLAAETGDAPSSGADVVGGSGWEVGADSVEASSATSEADAHIGADAQATAGAATGAEVKTTSETGVNGEVTGSGSVTSWRAARARRRGLEGSRRSEAERSGDELLGFADLLAEAMDVYHHRTETRDEAAFTAVDDDPVSATVGDDSAPITVEPAQRAEPHRQSAGGTPVEPTGGDTFAPTARVGSESGDSASYRHDGGADEPSNRPRHRKPESRTFTHDQW